MAGEGLTKQGESETCREPQQTDVSAKYERRHRGVDICAPVFRHGMAYPFKEQKGALELQPADEFFPYMFRNNRTGKVRSPGMVRTVNRTLAAAGGDGGSA